MRAHSRIRAISARLREYVQSRSSGPARAGGALIQSPAFEAEIQSGDDRTRPSRRAGADDRSRAHRAKSSVEPSDASTRRRALDHRRGTECRCWASGVHRSATTAARSFCNCRSKAHQIRFGMWVSVASSSRLAAAVRGSAARRPGAIAGSSRRAGCAPRGQARPRPDRPAWSEAPSSCDGRRPAGGSSSV